MKKLLRTIALTALALAVLPAGAQTPDPTPKSAPSELQAADDALAYAVDVVERAYAGYPDKTAGRREEYAALKARLQNEIAAGRDPFDAVAEYLGWFDDSHLGTPGVVPYRPKAKRRDTYYTGRMKCYDPQFTHCLVDADTYLIRFPSCDPDTIAPEEVQRMVDAYLASGCVNLVLDIRGNGGGSDSTYEPLLRLLYDREGVLHNIEYRASDLAIAHIREFGGGSERARRRIEQLQKTIPGEFLPVAAPTYTLRYDSVSPLPRRAALLIDARVGSSGEQLVLELRACSVRTTICGRDNTLGCLDYSNCEILYFPQDTTRWMQLPVTRSCRVDAGCGIDRDGIAPDVQVPLPLPDTLTNNVDAWVLWAAEMMKTQKPTE